MDEKGRIAWFKQLVGCCLEERLRDRERVRSFLSTVAGE